MNFGSACLISSSWEDVLGRVVQIDYSDWELVWVCKWLLGYLVHGNCQISDGYSHFDIRFSLIQ